MSKNVELIHSDHVEVTPIVAVQLCGESASEPADIARAMCEGFSHLMDFMKRKSIVMSGPPRAIYTAYGPEGTKFILAVPINHSPSVQPEHGVFIGSVAGSSALRFTHVGPYRNLMATYGRITEYLLAKGMMKSENDWQEFMPMWEEYLNDPETTPEADLVTRIYLPLNES